MGSLARKTEALLVASLALLGGCPAHVPPPATVATLRPEQLPNDLAELDKRLDKLSQTHDRVELENGLVVADKILSLRPNDFDAAWHAARACFWLDDEAEGDKSRRAYFADRGVKYADIAVKAKPDAVEGWYYRALNRGYLAKTKKLGAIEVVGDMAKDAKKAVELDPRYDGAGPLRAYGTVLLKAPGWPTSVGDPDEAKEQLAKAVELAPEHPLNHLYYAEALLANDKPEDAKKQLEEARKLADTPNWQFARARLIAEIDQVNAKVAEKLKK